ncbi:GNAT family N-acetyltransferase, partial [Vibrio parahaemolyticus]
ELAVYEKAPDEVTVTLEHFEESGFGPNPVWWAFVAEIENKVEAFALYYIRYSTWKGQRMYLEDILVTEKLRGK